MSQFANVDTTPLDEDDASDVSDEVYSLASKYFQLGQALRLPPSKLNEIRGNNSKNSATALNDVIVEWLRKNYKVAKFGEPTWRMLVEAIAKPSGGGNRALAMEVAGRHSGTPFPLLPPGHQQFQQTSQNMHQVHYQTIPPQYVQQPFQQVQQPIQQPFQQPIQRVQQTIQQPFQQPVQRVEQPVQFIQQPAQPTQSVVYQQELSLPEQETMPSGEHQSYSDLIVYSDKDIEKVSCDGGGENDYELLNPYSDKRRTSMVQLTFDVVTPRRGLSKSSKFGYYPMRNRPHGIAVIINNEQFAKQKEREGTQIDEKNLTTTFRILGYVVEIHRDRTSQQMLKIMQDMSQRDHSQYDSFVCCILSHGKEGQIYGTDSRMVPVDEITKHLNADSCPTLASKPKLFFLQACRGKMKEEGHRIESDSDDDPLPQVMTERGVRVMTDSDTMIPIAADFFFGYATPMGTVAWRDLDYGSWYVAELCRILCQESLHASLNDMMMEVHRRVGTEYDNIGYKQAPESTSRLNYDVFF